MPGYSAGSPTSSFGGSVRSTPRRSDPETAALAMVSMVERASSTRSSAWFGSSGTRCSTTWPRSSTWACSGAHAAGLLGPGRPWAHPSGRRETLGQSCVVFTREVRHPVCPSGRHHTGRGRRPGLARSGALSTLPAPVTGSRGTTRTKRGTHFGPRSGWAARKAPNGRVKRARIRHLHRRHHLVARDGVRHAVYGDAGGRAPTVEDALDRAGGEVFSVDPQPVGGPTGEVHPAVGIAVAEVAGPVPPVPGARPSASGCCSTPRTPTPGCGPRSRRSLRPGCAAGRRRRVRRRPVPGRLGVDDRHVGAFVGPPERAGGIPPAGAMTTAFSVEPYPSNTGQRNRRENSAMFCGDASEPNAHRKRLSASSGVSGTASR